MMELVELLKLEELELFVIIELVLDVEEVKPSEDVDRLRTSVEEDEFDEDSDSGPGPTRKL